MPGGESVEVLVARLDERYKAILASLERIETQLERQNSRLRKAEMWQSRLAGALVLIGILTAGVGGALWRHLWP